MNEMYKMNTVQVNYEEKYLVDNAEYVRSRESLLAVLRGLIHPELITEDSSTTHELMETLCRIEYTLTKVITALPLSWGDIKNRLVLGCIDQLVELHQTYHCLTEEMKLSLNISI